MAGFQALQTALNPRYLPCFDLMHKQTELTTTHRTKLIRFWSYGKMARSAFDRIEEHRSKDQAKEAESMLAEWILDL